jgi:hypothetical protein
MQNNKGNDKMFLTFVGILLMKMAFFFKLKNSCLFLTFFYIAKARVPT